MQIWQVRIVMTPVIDWIFFANFGIEIKNKKINPLTCWDLSRQSSRNNKGGCVNKILFYEIAGVTGNSYIA